MIYHIYDLIGADLVTWFVNFIKINNLIYIQILRISIFAALKRQADYVLGFEILNI